MKDGVIADFEATERMLRHFIHQVHRRRYFAKPRMVICVPSGITAVEQRAVKEAGYQAGARKVYIIEEPMAAAIGAGLPVHQATGNMVVDVGGGTTEVAVISLGGIVTSLSIRTAGDDLDAAIVAWMKKEYSLLLGERTAEEVKMSLGSAFPMPDEPEAEIRGRDMVSGLPRTVVVSSAEVRQALDEPLHAIVDAVRSTLDQTPPELAGDIMDRGIVLTGGGALLRGLDERLRHETGMPVHVAEDPLDLGRLRRRQVRGGVRRPPAGPRHRAAAVLVALLERPQRAAEPRPAVPRAPLAPAAEPAVRRPLCPRPEGHPVVAHRAADGLRHADHAGPPGRQAPPSIPRAERSARSSGRPSARPTPSYAPSPRSPAGSAARTPCASRSPASRPTTPGCAARSRRPTSTATGSPSTTGSRPPQGRPATPWSRRAWWPSARRSPSPAR